MSKYLSAFIPIVMLLAATQSQAVYFTPDYYDTFDFSKLFNPETRNILSRLPVSEKETFLWRDFEARTDAKSYVAEANAAPETGLKPESESMETMKGLMGVSSGMGNPLVQDLSTGTSGIDTEEIGKYLFASTGNERARFIDLLVKE